MKNIKILLLLAFAAIIATSCTEDDPEIIAGFTFTPEEGIQVGDSVIFTNTSVDATAYSWNFGDSGTSDEANPFHIYTEPGIYDVTLTAISNGISEVATQQVSVAANFAFVINYGSYTGGKSTISAFNVYSADMQNGYYKTVNGVDKVSNIQYAYHYQGNIYFMDNNVDGLSWVDSKSFEQTSNAVTAGINKPRNCVGNGDYLYVSCWESDDIFGGNIEISYIAKVDLNTMEVVNKISVHGGPEGLEIVGDKLYAALTFKNAIAVIDLASENVTYVDTTARTTNFEKDGQNNLYVTLTRDWDDYVTQTGIGYFNTSTDQLEETYPLDGVGTSYDNVIEPNADFSKLYVMSSGYDANWNVSGNIAVFDVATKSFETNNFVEGISGINGVGFYNNKVLCFISEAVTGNGKMQNYNIDGTLDSEYETGIAPFMLLTVE